MANFNNLVQLPITQNQLRQALSKALLHNFTDNLRTRPKTIQLDCKIRGYLGEIAIKNWFYTHQIYFTHTNLSANNFEIDIDLAFKTNNKTYNLEVKTSLIPDNYKTIQNSLNFCDIKIIKRTNTIEELSGDVHLQIYFNLLRKNREDKLSNKLPDWNNLENIIQILDLEQYLNNTFFVAWIDKPTLIQQINCLPKTDSTWTFLNAQKKFWKCNLKSSGKNPLHIIDYLKNL